MSVSQLTSSMYSRSSTGVPCTMPTETAATGPVMGEAASLPSAISLFTASCAATKAPVMAARARAAVGLQHVAIELDGALAQRLQVEHGAHRAADQALDFLGAAALLAAGRLAVAAGVGGRAAACRIRP